MKRFSERSCSKQAPLLRLRGGICEAPGMFRGQKARRRQMAWTPTMFLGDDRNRAGAPPYDKKAKTIFQQVFCDKKPREYTRNTQVRKLTWKHPCISGSKLLQVIQVKPHFSDHLQPVWSESPAWQQGWDLGMSCDLPLSPWLVNIVVLDLRSRT